MAVNFFYVVGAFYGVVVFFVAEVAFFSFFVVAVEVYGVGVVHDVCSRYFLLSYDDVEYHCDDACCEHDVE